MRWIPLLTAVFIAVPGCARDWSLPFSNGNGHCQGAADCPIGLCTDGACQFACHIADDCGGDYTCMKVNTSDEYGYCRKQGERPELQGDPEALSMLDNLEVAYQFVAERYDQVYLSRIVGIGLKADGTIDITAQNSSWNYYFQDGTGESGPATLMYVVYWWVAGGSYTDFYPEVGDSPLQVIQVDEWRAFRDSTGLVSAFLEQPGCEPPQQGTQDSLFLDRAGDDLMFIVRNWKNQLYTGDPITGVAVATCGE